MCVFLSGFYINLKWVTSVSCHGAREHKIYYSEVGKTAICIKITSVFILNSLTWASWLPAHSYAVVAVGHAITKLLCSSEYQGHGINEFLCTEMPLNKDFSPCLVTLSLLNRVLVCRWLMLPVRSCVRCSPLDGQCFALCVEHQARAEQSS